MYSNFGLNREKRVSQGLADMDYCRKMEEEVPITAQYLLDHGVKLNHHDEKNVLLEFKTDQVGIDLSKFRLGLTFPKHFVFPEGGGNAIIGKLFEAMKNYDGLDIMWETQAIKLLMTDAGETRGVKVRKTDGRLSEVLGKKVMLACGGFEGQ